MTEQLGERVAVLKSRVDALDDRVDTLTDAWLEPRIYAVEKAMTTMTEQVVPAIHKTLEQSAKDIAAIGDKMKRSNGRFESLWEVLKATARVVEAVGVGVILWWIAQNP